MFRFFTLRFVISLFATIGGVTSVAHASPFPFDFNFGVETASYSFQTYGLTSDVSVHCLSGCPIGTYINYFPSEDQIQLGSVFETKGTTFADYVVPQSFFTLGFHSDGIYTMNVVLTPEPSTFSLLGIGIVGLLGFVKRNKLAV